ncbi:hypothetical protein Ancab_004286 [Ancistrocladus abbreviatus]
MKSIQLEELDSKSNSSRWVNRLLAGKRSALPSVEKLNSENSQENSNEECDNDDGQDGAQPTRQADSGKRQMSFIGDESSERINNKGNVSKGNSRLKEAFMDDRLNSFKDAQRLTEEDNLRKEQASAPSNWQISERLIVTNLEDPCLGQDPGFSNSAEQGSGLYYLTASVHLQISGYQDASRREKAHNSLPNQTKVDRREASERKPSTPSIKIEGVKLNSKTKKKSVTGYEHKKSVQKEALEIKNVSVEGGSINDSNIRNMNRLIITNQAESNAMDVWPIRKLLDVTATREEQEALQWKQLMEDRDRAAWEKIRKMEQKNDCDGADKQD